MDPLASGVEKDQQALSSRAARAKLEEDLGKLDITDEEATTLVVDDREEKAQPKWMVAGKRDRDRVWTGLPWHVSKNAVILSEFEDCMKPSELKFDRLSLWARIINLPFNLRHADLVCSTPGTRRPNGELPFGKSLRAADEWRKPSYSDGSMDEKGFYQNGKANTRNSSTSADVGSDATSPLKKSNLNKRKPGTPNQVYRKVEMPPLKDTAEACLAANNAVVIYDNSAHVGMGASTDEGEVDRNSKRKKPTPTSSENLAEAAMQPCPEQ
ncbi:hypothetical protein ACQ4PT_049646 [Festuca glaucescens]